MGKRVQRKYLGKMRSICWTDHANVTRLQTQEPTEIEVKHLRWVSEIVADGTQIRSLAGRSARLGDGTSRNPSNRDALMAQRNKDLTGLVGQVRGQRAGKRRQEKRVRKFDSKNPGATKNAVVMWANED